MSEGRGGGGVAGLVAVSEGVGAVEWAWWIPGAVVRSGWAPLWEEAQRRGLSVSVGRVGRPRRGRAKASGVGMGGRYS